MILSFAPGRDISSQALALGLPSLIALVCYVAAAMQNERWAQTLRQVLLVGWVAHGLSLLVDVAGVGSEPSGARFGFAPALSMTVWFVLAVYQLERHFIPLPAARRALAACGAVVVVVAWLFPGQVHPQAGSAWAPLHWLLGIASYGLFGAAVLHALLLSRAERHMRATAQGAGARGEEGGMPLLRLERLTFRFVAAGFVVLTAAIVLGITDARPWRWDHKSVFSLLGWLVFAALLAGRRTFGWRGPRATGWVYAGAALLLLAYVGSRFVLEVLLHRAPAG